MSDEAAHNRFQSLFRETERDLLGYALRRVDRPEDAADVVAETFLVAWRRLGDVPLGDSARLWLFGVARRQLANQNRSRLRQNRLADRLRRELPAAIAADPSSFDDGASWVLDALQRLGSEDRELITLSAWEGLEPSEIATVLQIRAATVRSRLHRARKRLRAELARDDAVSPHNLAAASPLSKEIR